VLPKNGKNLHSLKVAAWGFFSLAFTTKTHIVQPSVFALRGVIFSERLPCAERKFIQALNFVVLVRGHLFGFFARAHRTHGEVRTEWSLLWKVDPGLKMGHSGVMIWLPQIICQQ